MGSSISAAPPIVLVLEDHQHIFGNLDPDFDLGVAAEINHRLFPTRDHDGARFRRFAVAPTHLDEGFRPRDDFDVTRRSRADGDLLDVFARTFNEHIGVEDLLLGVRRQGGGQEEGGQNCGKAHVSLQWLCVQFCNTIT